MRDGQSPRIRALKLALGGACAVLCLMLLGPDRFLAPALAATAQSS